MSISNKKKTKMSITIEPDLLESFNTLAKKKGYNKSQTIRNFIRSLIEAEKKTA